MQKDTAVTEPTIRKPEKHPKMDGGFILKTLYEIYAKQNGLRLEYTLDREAKTFTYALYDAQGNLVSVNV